jgi:two-component system sensor histidine kinase BarA
VTIRNTSPLAYQQRDNALLSTSRTAAPAAPAPRQLAAGDHAPAASEHCSQRRFIADTLEKPKRKSRDFDRIIREKAELLGIAVHDLRLPITTIQIYSELLAEGIGNKASSELIEWISSIQSVSEFALRLLDETADFAMVESGITQLYTTPTVLASIVAKSVTMSRPLAARKRIHLAFLQSGEPRPVLVDRVKMTKVFNNLIGNAIKYCQPGARIEVCVWRVEDRLIVAVDDDGPGIEPTDLKTLFTPFQKTRARALSEEPSAGLGLAIAKHIVHLHGGQISVRSEIGAGTTFYVSLPTCV